MNYQELLGSIVALHRESLGKAVAAVNRWLVLRNWLIGAYLIEFEQEGAERAAYGEHLLESVSADLKKREVRGLGVSMLKNSRQFYRFYPQIRQSLPGTLAASTRFPGIRQSLIGEFGERADQSPPAPSRDPSPLAAERLLSLSWTHLIELIRLNEPWKRAFYENECLNGNWSVRQLQRQIGSLLYERTGLSRDKQGVVEAARQQAEGAPTSIADLIRDPGHQDLPANRRHERHHGPRS